MTSQIHEFKDEAAQNHSFINSPHTTLMRLSIPVLFSLVAEPLTGFVDTAFVSRLGTESLAALGVGTTVLSSIFWVFNFLGIGSQTEVAKAMGHGNKEQVLQVAGLALSMGAFFGVFLILFLFPFSATLTHFMGATGAVHTLGMDYFNVRLFGAPAIIVSFAAFGIMRGRQDMAMPLWIAGGVNLLNIVLDPVLIFGWGIFPDMGVTGAALASVISQWLGALACVVYVFKRLGRPRKPQLSQAVLLLRVGRDLFIRTGMLTLFLLLSTRAATAIGPASGAAHQAIRQAWIFTAFLMDAYAVAGQSLVAYFMGAGFIHQARRVASVVCGWSLFTGVVLTLGMLVGQQGIVMLLVPEAAVSAFTLPWLISALTQPISSLAFATDGIHWGTGDFQYLRNVVILATGMACILLFFFEYQGALTLEKIWLITALWAMIRSLGGVLRIWPGSTHSPLIMESFIRK